MPSTAADGFIHVVAAVIRDPDNPNRIYITQRQRGQHLEDLWEFPGGKLEASESRFQGLKRELQEEIGIEVFAALPIMSVRHRYPDKSVFLDVWEIRAYDGEPKGCEGQEGRWIDLDKLEFEQFPEADWPVLQALGLPGHLLITPELEVAHRDSFVGQFERVMSRQRYPLVLFRAHSLADDVYVELAGQMQSIAGDHGGELIIHRPRLQSIKSKLFHDFSRFHINSYLLQDIKRNPLPNGAKLSASCHDLDEIRQAERLGCTFGLLSCIRATASHPGRQVKGWLGFKQLARKSRLPLFALGGVKRRDIFAARYQGAVGVAGIGDFWSA
jgi:8-oxo-dGTP diphosphatase